MSIDLKVIRDKMAGLTGEPALIEWMKERIEETINRAGGFGWDAIEAQNRLSKIQGLSGEELLSYARKEIEEIPSIAVKGLAEIMARLG